jgi:hypothetical protein
MKNLNQTLNKQEQQILSFIGEKGQCNSSDLVNEYMDSIERETMSSIKRVNKKRIVNRFKHSM